ncbi:MAG: PilZ domain-containing protein [Planctomycetota bacterium]
MAEQRKNPRVDSLNLVTFTSFDDEGVILSNAYSRTLNLSKEGMLIEMRQAPAINTLILISLGIGEKIIQVQGKIARVETQPDNLLQVGISFINVNPYDQKVLHDYLRAKEEIKE